jgi:hypothetical protein
VAVVVLFVLELMLHIVVDLVEVVQIWVVMVVKVTHHLFHHHKEMMVADILLRNRVRIEEQEVVVPEALVGKQTLVLEVLL